VCPTLFHQKVLRIESSPSASWPSRRWPGGSSTSHCHCCRRRVVWPGGRQSLKGCQRAWRTLRGARDLAQFAGRQVVVIGPGRVTLESAALLAEGGCPSRSDRTVARNSLASRMGLGSCFIMAWAQGLRGSCMPPPMLVRRVSARSRPRPDLLKRLPRRLQDRFGSVSVRPAAAPLLQTRLEMSQIVFGRRVVS